MSLSHAQSRIDSEEDPRSYEGSFLYHLLYHLTSECIEGALSECLTDVGSFWLVRLASNLGEDSIEKEWGHIRSRGHRFTSILV